MDKSKKHSWCDLDIQDIRCFVVYIEEGTSARAGIRLHMTGTNVLYRAKVIQHHVGIPLFLSAACRPHSGGRKFLDLTEFGKLVYHILVDILQRYDNMVELLRVYNPNDVNKRFRTTHGVPFNLHPGIPQTVADETTADVGVWEQLQANFPGVFHERNKHFYTTKKQLAAPNPDGTD